MIELAGGGNTLLQGAHLGGQRGLVADGRGIRPSSAGHLRACLGEAEDVIDEEQHILILHIAEILRHGQAGQCHAHTGSWGFVHLAIDQRSLVDNARSRSFRRTGRCLTGALANAGEHRVAVVLGGNVIDQLLDQDRLADACTAEQTDLAALGVGQIRSTTLMPVSRISVVDCCSS